MQRNSNFTKAVITVLLLGLCIMGVTGCADKSNPPSSSRFVSSMDTVMNLTAYGKNSEAALDAAEAEIYRLNDLLSTEKETSEVYQINHGATNHVSSDTAYLMERSLDIYKKTNGLFDITVYPLTRLWGFPTKEYHVPNDQELCAVMAAIGADQIEYDAENRTVKLGKNQAIDFGGIAKGYTSQRIMDIFKEHNLTSGLVSLGGNIQCLGTKPDGSNWNIGIQDPWSTNGNILAVLSVSDCAVITSGGYERNFTDPATGIVYRHILDTRTGFPAESGLASVTIVTKDGTLGDALSTSLYVMGLEQGIDYWRDHQDEFQAVFIDEDKNIYATDGLKNIISSGSKISYLQ